MGHEKGRQLQLLLAALYTLLLIMKTFLRCLKSSQVQRQ